MIRPRTLWQQKESKLNSKPIIFDDFIHTKRLSTNLEPKHSLEISIAFGFDDLNTRNLETVDEYNYLPIALP